MKKTAAEFDARPRPVRAARSGWMRTLAAFALLASFASSAADAPAPAAPQPTLRQIVDQQTQLRVQVAEARGAFKEMYPGDRERLLKQQDRLLQLIGDRQSMEELRVEERVEVFNTLQEVNAAATKAEDERTICERTRLAGSHRFSTVCMSGREYREHKENARKSVRTVMKCQAESRGSKACKSD